MSNVLNVIIYTVQYTSIYDIATQVYCRHIVIIITIIINIIIIIISFIIIIM